jgi:hypothetical protein
MLSTIFFMPRTSLAGFNVAPTGVVSAATQRGERISFWTSLPSSRVDSIPHFS